MFARDDVCRDHRPLPHEGIATCQLHEEDDRVCENDGGRDGRKSSGAPGVVRQWNHVGLLSAFRPARGELGQELQLLRLCLD